MRTREKAAMVRALRARVESRLEATAAYQGEWSLAPTERQLLLAASRSELCDVIEDARKRSANSGARAAVLEEFLIDAMEDERDLRERGG